MEDITWYVVDINGYFMYSVTQSPYASIPTPSTDIPPPETTGTEVAVFKDWLNKWEVLPSKPVPPPPIIQPYQVDAERDRRTAMGFIYAGKAYQTENQSQIDDILGKMTDALAAITVDQAQAGDLRWASPDYDFAWSAADGTLVPMDAQTCLAFTRAAVRRKTLLVGAGLALKAMSPIPVDYMDDKYWPPMDSTAKAARK